MDESVLSIAITHSSKFMVTGDSHGLLKTWSLAGLLDFWTARGFERAPPPDSIKPLAAWRGHQGGVSSIAAMDAHEALFLTSGFDNDVALWSVHGAHVGTFGQDAWALEDRGSWVAQASEPLAKVDFQRMQQSVQPDYVAEALSPAGSLAFSADDRRTASLKSTPGGAPLARPQTAPHAGASGTSIADNPAAASGGAADEHRSAWESVQALLGECAPSKLHMPPPVRRTAAALLVSQW